LSVTVHVHALVEVAARHDDGLRGTDGADTPPMAALADLSHCLALCALGSLMSMNSTSGLSL